MKKETTISELAQKFDFLMFGDCPDWTKGYPPIEIPPTGLKAKGFTIGRGKQLYWFITPSSNTGKYRCHPQYDNGEIGYGRWIYPETKITIHYI